MKHHDVGCDFGAGIAFEGIVEQTDRSKETPLGQLIAREEWNPVRPSFRSFL